MNTSPLRSRFRPHLAALLGPLARPLRSRLEVGRDGRRLEPGIAAVVSARDEAYTIPFCLESLLGFADQIVCIDNGSVDNTLARMEDFVRRHGHEVDVEIRSMPGALLGECREAGLQATNREWHLRWDADMVGKTTGPERLVALRERVLRDDRPRAIQLPRTNLYGDLRHTGRIAPAVDPGEPILIRFGRSIEYREFGRFDTVRLPLYYGQEREDGRHYFHLAGLKGDDNLIHRFHYFAWRQAVNAPGATPPEVADFTEFQRRRNLDLFGTNDTCALRFRFQRQLVQHFTLYDAERFGAYPAILRDELARGGRFEVVYRDGRPWRRIDREDGLMLAYEPTPEDLRWDPAQFLRRFLSDEECLALELPAPADAAAGGGAA